MSDDKRQSRKRIEIPTPKELDESAISGQSQHGELQEQKGVRSRVRRFRMRMRGGVGRNKKVLKAPRPDAGSVKETTPNRQDLGDVESTVGETSSEPVIGDDSDREGAVPSEADTETDSVLKDKVCEEDKQEEPPGSRIRIIKTPTVLKKRKEEPVPVPEDTPKKKLTLEEQACAAARAHAQEHGHEIGEFVPKAYSSDSVSSAICKKCGLNIDAVVGYDFKEGLPRIGGKAKGQTCKGVGGYSSGTS